MISVVVATYGDFDTWSKIAARALASACHQTVAAHEVIYEHGDTLARARNAGAARASGTHLVFLDADDELDGRYIEAMTAAAVDDTPVVLYQPATVGVEDGRVVGEPNLIEPSPLGFNKANHLIIGTMIPKALFDQVGGFRDDLEVLEDWDLWCGSFDAGARWRRVPGAVYRIHFVTGSRNKPGPAHLGAARNIRSRWKHLRPIPESLA